MSEPIRILHIEDSPIDAKLVARELRRVDPNVVVDGVDNADALRTALARGPWDAVISDWSMPDFDALSALEIVRAVAGDLPFIIVSGTIGEELAVDAMRAGAHDYVLKDKLARLVPAIEREMREHKRRVAHRREEARFRAIIERSEDPILLTDVDGRLLYASPASAGMFGVPAAELIGRLGLELIHPDDRALVASAMAAIREQPSTNATIEYRPARPDGVERWVALTRTNLLADPAVGAIVSNVRDVTERHRADDALRASETRFSRLAQSGVIGILTADVHGKILNANDAYANMLGYTVEELTSDAFRWIDMVPKDLAESTQRASEQLKTEGIAGPWETASTHKNGARVPMLVGIAMLEYPVCIAFSIDLTERKRAEEALRVSEDQLRQAQKMEAVGRLAGGVAHDFNNILSVVLSYAEMLRDDLPPGDPKRDDVEQIYHAGRHAADLTRQLLMFSRQQVLEPRNLDLNQVLANMHKILRRVLGEDVELVTRRAESLGTIHSDPSSIEQVIMNLVVNARDAMPIGGTLTLETKNVMVDDDHVRRHGGIAAGPHVVFSVTDTGVGMDLVTQARIFEPFFTTKSKDKGTGLGLSTVFGIVQLSRGSIVVRSEPGVGTTFDVYLPCIAGAIEAAQLVNSVAARGTETILLVEDEARVRRVARGILERHGYAVLEAANPGEAIAIGLEYTGDIHLLLTDVVMPQMSGPEDLAKRIARQRPNVKVLCMSGYTDDSIVRHGILNADIAFLQKPLTVESLTRKVRDVLDARLRR